MIQGTGRVERDRAGLELFVERRVAAPLGEVEAWLLGQGPDDAQVSAVELGDETVVYFSRRVASAAEAGDVGPELEFTLDRMVAALTGGVTPDRARYETLRPYYERLAMDGDPVSWPPS